ncbi:uncharacterized protein LOC133339203 [Lethenteron reissneri]|uniref:uncharacterized protein LOC133339203 n=1 Tax=Lethenteron reissneri TaxID=7753 RepID=UPI002AB707B0|nr:uncharacterized protein LOC133339203 [Lethenteron reissneri]
MSSSDLGLFSDDDNAGLRSRRSHRDDDGEDGDDDDDEEEDDEDDRLSVKSDSLQWLQAGDTLPWNLPRHQRAKMRRPHESVLDPAERAVLRIAGERTPAVGGSERGVARSLRSDSAAVGLGRPFLP